MTREPGTHGYICECNLRTCGETIYIRHDTYLLLSRYGVLMSKGCARREDRVIMGDYGEFVVAATSWPHPACEIGMDNLAITH